MSCVVDCLPCKLPDAMPGLPSINTNGCTKPTKKIAYDLTENEDYDREDIATYEEIVKLHPRPGAYRPLGTFSHLV